MPLPDSSWPIRRFLGRLASSDPAPGGGSAAALAGCLGCALGAMVGRILLSRSKIRPAEKRLLRHEVRDLERARGRLERLIRLDASAYRGLVAAQRLGGSRLLKAKRAAVACPLEICRQTAEGMRLLRGFSRRTGPYLGADLRGGQALLKGAFGSAREMALVNLKSGGLGAAERRVRSALERLERQAERWNGKS